MASNPGIRSNKAQLILALSSVTAPAEIRQMKKDKKEKYEICSTHFWLVSVY